MRLTELEPQFVRHAPGQMIHVAMLVEAQGLWMLCPTCFAKNNGPVGTHGLIVTFRDRGVPDALGSHGKNGVPSRWTVTGTGYDDLTLSPSIDISKDGDGEWHGYIINGEIR